MTADLDPLPSCPSRRSAARSRGAVLLSLLLPLGAVSCGADGPEDLAPPPGGQGQQFKMVTTLSPGQEIERCQFFVAPPEGLNIKHDEVRYTPGSHHVLLYLTPYQQIPTKDQRGNQRDTSGIMDCPEGATADWQVIGVLAGAQKRDGGSMVSFPPDTAFKVPGGAVLLMNTHYLNASVTPLTAETRVNVYTIPDDKLRQQGGLLFYYNPFIHIGPHARASARMRCDISSDIQLTNVQSHMHKRGINYEAFVVDPPAGGGRSQQPLYTNTEWENVPVRTFDPALTIRAGSSLDYRCDYKNDEDRTVIQGASTKDEMCMLIGSYYPRQPELEGCKNPRWVGTGSKSCQVSMSCAIAAVSARDNEGFYGCVVNSCEAAAEPLSDALMCFFTQGNGACDAKCKSPAAADCNDCITQACASKFSACTQTRC
jgi:hypothetical protein